MTAVDSALYLIKSASASHDRYPRRGREFRSEIVDSTTASAPTPTQRTRLHVADGLRNSLRHTYSPPQTDTKHPGVLYPQQGLSYNWRNPAPAWQPGGRPTTVEDTSAANSMQRFGSTEGDAPIMSVDRVKQLRSALISPTNYQGVPLSGLMRDLYLDPRYTPPLRLQRLASRSSSSPRITREMKEMLSRVPDIRNPKYEVPVSEELLGPGTAGAYVGAGIKDPYLETWANEEGLSYAHRAALNRQRDLAGSILINPHVVGSGGLRRPGVVLHEIEHALHDEGRDPEYSLKDHMSDPEYNRMTELAGPVGNADKELASVLSESAHLSEAIKRHSTSDLNINLSPDYQMRSGTLADLATRHGHVDGHRSMYELLTTPQGLSWVKHLINRNPPHKPWNRPPSYARDNLHHPAQIIQNYQAGKLTPQQAAERIIGGQ